MPTASTDAERQAWNLETRTDARFREVQPQPAEARDFAEKQARESQLRTVQAGAQIEQVFQGVIEHQAP